MPGLDETGPMGNGPMTGGRRGRCVGVADAPPGSRGMGYGRALCDGRGMGFGRGGRGYRNQYYATGFTGWQRTRMDAAADVSQAPRDDRMERLEQRLDEAVARLARLEGTE